MARLVGLRHGAGALALTTLVASIGCGLMSGLDRLQEVPCVQACGDVMGVADADEVETFSQTIPEGGQGDDSNALDSDASGQATANDGRSPADSPDVSRDALADSVPAPNEANIADAMPADSNTDANVADAMPAGNDANVADAMSRDSGSQAASDSS